VVYFLTVLGLACIFLLFLAPRPKLKPIAPKSTVPDGFTLTELNQWLQKTESETPGITAGAEALIEFADSENPARTEICFLYIHGFSASRLETAPVTSMIASHYNSNVFHARLAGHGVGTEGMLASAESWLQSMIDAWKISEYLGNRVVIVATSTGATLAVWLLKQKGIADKVAAILMMSPNFKIKNPFGFLLTWPWSPHWVHLILGSSHSWEAESPAHARAWTTSYSTLAVIEMQKMVDWISKLDLATYSTPLAMMCMKNDPTVNAGAATNAFVKWGSELKSNIPVEIDSDKVEHVFTGHLAGPHRTETTVAAFINFLEPILSSVVQPDHPIKPRPTAG